MEKKGQLAEWHSLSSPLHSLANMSEIEHPMMVDYHRAVDATRAEVSSTAAADSVAAFYFISPHPFQGDTEMP